MKKIKISFFGLSRIFVWLEKIFYFWLRSKVIPKDISELSLDGEKPICYVLKTQSLTDLIVLDHHCRKLGIPRPTISIDSLINNIEPDKSKSGASLYLAKGGAFFKKGSKKLPTGLLKLIRRVEEESLDIQLVPVSVFWGRDSGKEEKSLLKLLFFDDESGGWLQRFFLFFVQGRNIYCHIEKPISCLDFYNKNKDVTSVVRKLNMVLKVHFRRQREAVTGPRLYDRRSLIKAIINSKTVNEAINKEINRSGKNKKNIEAVAYKYANEIASNMKPNIIRLCEIIFQSLFNKMYDKIVIKNDHDLLELAKDHELVYLPCHKSHMDYLLLNVSLYQLGLIPPHTAAGINMNFWPFGTMARRTGTFFIRRSFSGNSLYSAVFSEFTHFLLSNSYSMCFYLEGGRSRTGKLLSPKLGMLSMVLKSAKRQTEKPILLIPVYIGYDRLIEARSYLSELRGKSKKKESMKQVFQSRGVLKKKRGSAYINFGEPITLDNLISINDIPKQRVLLANKVLDRINQALCLTPVSLVSTLLLSLPQKAMGERELLFVIEQLLFFLKDCPYSDRVIFPEQNNARQMLAYAEKLAPITRFKHASNDVLYVDQKDSALLSYYKNNTVALFVLPSLIANLIVRLKKVNVIKLKFLVKFLYSLVWEKLNLRWHPSEIEDEFEKLLESFEKNKTTIRKGDEIESVSDSSLNYLTLKVLGCVEEEKIDRLQIYITNVFFDKKDDEIINISSLKESCESAVERFFLLKGKLFFSLDKDDFNCFISVLFDLKMIEKVDDFSFKIVKESSLLKDVKTYFEDFTSLS